MSCVVSGLVLLGAARAGDERYLYDSAGRLVRHTDARQSVVDYVFDAAGNLLAVRRAQAQDLAPLLTGLTPSVVRRGQSPGFVLSGERLDLGSLQATHPGIGLGRLKRAPQQITGQMSVGGDVPLGLHELVFDNGAGRAAWPVSVAPVLPLLRVEPSPLALPPQGAPQLITLRLSHPDVLPHQIDLRTSDPTRATVTPSRITLAAGVTAAQFTVTPRSPGFLSLDLQSDTLGPVSVPVFITTDFRGVNTSHATPVRVQVGSQAAPAPRRTQGLFGAQGVGVAVGSVLTGLAPVGMAVGGQYRMVVQGRALPADARVELIPPQGLSVTVEQRSDTRLQLQLQVDAGAAPGWRRLQLVPASGRPVPVASSGADLWQLTSGTARIEAIEPLAVLPGRVSTIRVRGHHLQQGRLQIDPGTDLRIDAEPKVNAEGTELVARIEVAPLAATGPRTVRVVTPSGSSPAEPSAGNQLTIASAIEQTPVTPVASPVVGVRVGSPSVAPAAASTLGLTRAGVQVGPGAWSVQPPQGVVGSEVEVEVTGVGLQAVRSVRLNPDTGVVIGPYQVDPDGRRLRFAARIDAQAPVGPRQVVLQGHAGPWTFAAPGSDLWAVVAPVPVLQAISPLVWMTGQTTTATVRGQHLGSVVSATALGPDGASDDQVIVRPLTASTDGTRLTLEARVAQGAVSGPRRLVLSAPAGSSEAAAQAGNTVQVARQIAGSVTPLASPLVGLCVGTVDAVTSPPATSWGLLAPLVGVSRAGATAPAGWSMEARLPATGVVVGAAVRGMQPARPDGLLKGRTGRITIDGIGLQHVTQVHLIGQGVTAGTPQVSADGRQIGVDVAVADNAPSGPVGVSLGLPTLTGDALQFQVGALPERLDSISPIVLEQGKTVTLVIRGAGLRDVHEVVVEPGNGLRQTSDVAWSTDALGERLTVSLQIAPDAAVGSRVVRLRVPGGITPASPTPANTLTTVAPQ